MVLSTRRPVPFLSNVYFQVNSKGARSSGAMIEVDRPSRDVRMHSIKLMIQTTPQLHNGRWLGIDANPEPVGAKATKLISRLRLIITTDESRNPAICGGFRCI
jgi:hypothetical protein